MNKMIVLFWVCMAACAAPSPTPRVDTMAHCADGDDGCVEHPIPHPGWVLISDVYEDNVTPESDPDCHPTGVGQRCSGRFRWDTTSGSYECSVDWFSEDGDIITTICDVGPDLTNSGA